MNLVVIGLGSMGKRRVRLLKQYIVQEKKDAWSLVGIDTDKGRRDECSRLYKIETFASLQEAKGKCHLDAAVISTSPLSHAVITEECLKENLHVFSELNLVDKGYMGNMALAKKQDKVLFLSSTFLYRKEIQYIKAAVKNRNQKGMYRYHIGQYLPEWHPWENYKNFFVGDKKTNACREIFAIELPWLTDCFGDIVKVQSIHRKFSDLDVDYDDSYQVMIEHGTGIIGTLVVDVVTPKTGREFEFFGEKFCITWNGTPDTMRGYNKDTAGMEKIMLYDTVEHEEGYDKFVVENAYYEELVNYIHVILGKDIPLYSFEQDEKILKIIDEIEE